MTILNGRGATGGAGMPAAGAGGTVAVGGALAGACAMAAADSDTKMLSESAFKANECNGDICSSVFVGILGF